MNLPVEVIDAVSERKAILFMGSGCSEEAATLAGLSYPEARTLAKTLGWKRPRIAYSTRPQQVTPSVMEGAARFEQTHGRDAMVDTLRQQVGFEIPRSGAHRIALERFPLVFTTTLDAALPAHAQRGDALPDPLPDDAWVVRLRGHLADPDHVVVTRTDLVEAPLSDAFKKRMKVLLRRQVALFIGYHLDSEEFEVLWEELTDCYGGELPRCHLAVPQGRIDDVLWQKWVWRGLLMFTADPSECLETLEDRLP